MTTIAEVRDGLAHAISTTGLRTMAYMSSSIPHPCCHVRPDGYDPRMVLGRAKAEYTFTATVFVGPAAERSAQKRCDLIREAWGNESIVQAVEDATNWPSDVELDYAAVTFVGEPTEVVIAEEKLMIVEFDIEVVF